MIQKGNMRMFEPCRREKREFAGEGGDRCECSLCSNVKTANIPVTFEKNAKKQKKIFFKLGFLEKGRFQRPPG